MVVLRNVSGIRKLLDIQVLDGIIKIWALPGTLRKTEFLLD
jgi:hypothetical protein